MSAVISGTTLITEGGERIVLMGVALAYLGTLEFGRTLARQTCTDCEEVFTVHPDLLGASLVCDTCHQRRSEFDPMRILNAKPGIMGTLDFDAQFPGMRKIADFVIYPKPGTDTSPIIIAQSDNRKVEMNLDSGEATISGKPFQLTEEERLHLREKVASTAGNPVGTYVQSDNSGAAIFAHDSVTA